MDYSYFNGAPQSYQFLGLPPTPGLPGSGTSEDFRDSPPDAFNPIQPFDSYNTQFNNGPAPNVKPATPVSQHRPSFESNGHQQLDLNNGNIDANDDSARRGGSNSDDDDMTPAQSRRKAQNRAAQRAFRERKERHVKDLEIKLAILEKASATVAEENERLKLQLQKASTENEILKATSSSSHRQPSPPPTSSPIRYSPTDFYTEVLHGHENKTPSHRIVLGDDGQKLLAAGATWDYIIKHPLFVRGMVDVGDVSERLKSVARCDGQGPVFEERAIDDAIEKSVASGSDDLL